jgi:hypothetical protein
MYLIALFSLFLTIHTSDAVSPYPRKVREIENDDPYMPSALTVNNSCTYNSDCNHGSCKLMYSHEYPNGTKVCDCDNGYLSRDGEICNYKQKGQLETFLFSFFLGWGGVPYFYVADGDSHLLGLGCLKIILTLLVCCGICGAFCCGAGEMITGMAVMACFSCLFAFGYIGWYLADFILIAIDPCNFKDGNGECLVGW